MSKAKYHFEKIKKKYSNIAQKFKNENDKFLFLSKLSSTDFETLKKFHLWQKRLNKEILSEAEYEIILSFNY